MLSRGEFALGMQARNNFSPFSPFWFFGFGLVCAFGYELFQVRIMEDGEAVMTFICYQYCHS